MVIVGAGGHSSEVLDVVLERKQNDNIYFFDDTASTHEFKNNYRIIKSIEEVETEFPNRFKFLLGIGNPHFRKHFFTKFHSIGGTFQNVQSDFSNVSSFSNSKGFDIMKFCFIGPHTTIGIGTLINTGAHIHHDVQIGEFTEISPRAVMLGGSGVGSLCSIGANVTILPKVKIGDNVIIGAGAVVTSDLPDNCLAVGVPAKIKKRLSATSV